MKTYTKDQIIEELRKAELGSITLRLIEEHFNNLEKPQFEPWKWYSHSRGAFMLYNPNCGDCQIGFTISGRFTDCIGPYGNEWHPATQEQIEPLIRAEAERRGLVEGAKFDSVPEFEGCSEYYSFRYSKTKITYITYCFEEDVLMTRYGVIYEKGRWATLVEEKSLEERVSELEKEVKCLNEKL